MQHKKIAFIGAGNMASAIISGLIHSGYPAELICACNKSDLARRGALKQMGVQVGLSNLQAVEWADCVILSVKPQIMMTVCAEFADLDFSDKWVLSVAAGMSVKRLNELLPTAKNIIRAMPRIPSLIGEGVSGIYAEKSVEPTACKFAEQLLSSVGQCYWVEEEPRINQITALTGSSPAYFFRFMESMQKSAVEMGFSEQDARRLIQSVALGAAKMVILNPEKSLSGLRESVTSKGGTTAQALCVFEQHQLDSIVNEAMNAAMKRAEEMEKLL